MTAPTPSAADTDNHLGPFKAAFLKGWRAWFDGGHCPYPDKRDRHGSVTFSRAFRRAWFAGRDAARIDHPDFHKRRTK